MNDINKKKFNSKQELGSYIAKSGFRNEHNISEKFNNYLYDEDAKKWLIYMNYDLNNIKKIISYHIPVNFKNLKYLISDDNFNNINYKKADIQVQIYLNNNKLEIENISLKKSQKSSDFNQIDKRKVSKYKKMWSFSDEIEKTLSLFTGEFIPSNYGFNSNFKRLIPIQFTKSEREELLNFLNKNKRKILIDILSGRGIFSAKYMIITEEDENIKKYFILNIFNVINFLEKYNFEISKKSTINLANGLIQFQRKGGTPDPTSLQFKFKPLKLLKELKKYNYIK